MARCEFECMGYCVNNRMQAYSDEANPAVKGFISRFKEGVYDCLTSPHCLADPSGKQSEECPMFGERVLAVKSR